MADHPERLERGEWLWDWTSGLLEYQWALYGENIEESVHLQHVLDLYPLHKRILGLVEYIMLPKLEQRGFDGKPSQLWTNGFLEAATDKTGNSHTGPLNSHPKKPTLGHLATLETEGNWLLHTVDHGAVGGAGPIDLAALLDGILTRMSSAREVTGVSVSLYPPTPQEHARQLAALADCSSPNATCMTLYLGKIALMLRNAVEHGTDQVEGNGLLVDTTHYWEQKRAGKTMLNWLGDTATTVSWRSSPSLPATLPGAANAFLLTPASLQRCLVLLSLVMHAGFSQLGL